MSSPMSVLKPHRKYRQGATRKSDDNLKLPDLKDRNRNLYGRNYHSGIEAYNFTSQFEEPEMPNLLCDYTNIDITHREPTPDNLDKFLKDFSPYADFSGGKSNRTHRSNEISPRNIISYTPTAPDVALMTSMAQRLRVVEDQLKSYSREIIEKDNKIKELELTLKSSGRGLVNKEGPNSSVSVLEKRCEALQKQVNDMEKFLEDYGMIWVGDDPLPNDGEDDNNESQELPNTPTDNGGGGGVSNRKEYWSPKDSQPNASNTSQQIPFNQIIRAVQDLNVLVGEGIARISQTKNGAVFKIPDAINLEFFADGFILFEGPFRLYTDPYSKEFLSDLLDGYFPSELREKYPDGVPFSLKDKRDVVYMSQDKPKELFPGSGHKLLQDLETRVMKSGKNRSAMNSAQFARKLPLSVVKNGKVIDIRGDIESQLNPKADQTKTKDDTTVLATDFMKEIYKVDPSGEDTSAIDSKVLENISTLRIRSEDGLSFYIAKMYNSETIADIKRYISQVIDSENSQDIQFVSTYPKKVYPSDSSQTLLDAGLSPSAVLMIKRPKNV